MHHATGAHVEEARRDLLANGLQARASHLHPSGSCAHNETVATAAGEETLPDEFSFPGFPIPESQGDSSVEAAIAALHGTKINKSKIRVKPSTQN